MMVTFLILILCAGYISNLNRWLSHRLMILGSFYRSFGIYKEYLIC